MQALQGLPADLILSLHEDTVRPLLSSVFEGFSLKPSEVTLGEGEKFVSLDTVSVLVAAGGMLLHRHLFIAEVPWFT